MDSPLVNNWFLPAIIVLYVVVPALVLAALYLAIRLGVGHGMRDHAKWVEKTRD